MSTIKDAYATPQYGEYGEDTGLWMLHTDQGYCPNLILGWLKGKYRQMIVEQVEEFYEEAEDIDEHTTMLVEQFDCFDLTDDEWPLQLARVLWDNDDSWWAV